MFLIDFEIVGFLVIFWFVFFMWWRRMVKVGGFARWGVGEEGKVVGIIMFKWGSFSIFVFLKKYRLYFYEEEACIFFIFFGMVLKIFGWK